MKHYFPQPIKIPKKNPNDFNDTDDEMPESEPKSSDFSHLGPSEQKKAKELLKVSVKSDFNNFDGIIIIKMERIQFKMFKCIRIWIQFQIILTIHQKLLIEVFKKWLILLYNFLEDTLQEDPSVSKLMSKFKNFFY